MATIGHPSIQPLPDNFSSLDTGEGTQAGDSMSAFWDGVDSVLLERITSVQAIEHDVSRTTSPTPSASTLYGTTSSGFGVSGDSAMTGTWSLLSGSGTLTQTSDWEHTLTGAPASESHTIRFTFDDPVAALNHMKSSSWLTAGFWLGRHSGSPVRVTDAWLTSRLDRIVTLTSGAWVQKRYTPRKPR